MLGGGLGLDDFGARAMGLFLQKRLLRRFASRNDCEKHQSGHCERSEAISECFIKIVPFRILFDNQGYLLFPRSGLDLFFSGNGINRVSEHFIINEFGEVVSIRKAISQFVDRATFIL